MGMGESLGMKGRDELCLIMRSRKYGQIDRVPSPVRDCSGSQARSASFVTSLSEFIMRTAVWRYNPHYASSGPKFLSQCHYHNPHSANCVHDPYRAHHRTQSTLDPI